MYKSSRGGFNGGGMRTMSISQILETGRDVFEFCDLDMFR